MRRLRFLLRQRGWQSLAIFGFALIVIGLLLVKLQPYFGAILTGTGTSLLASFIVTWLGPASDESYQRFRRLGVTEVYPSRKAFPNERWVQWLREAKHNCILFGVAHEQWCKDPDFGAHWQIASGTEWR